MESSSALFGQLGVRVCFTQPSLLNRTSQHSAHTYAVRDLAACSAHIYTRLYSIASPALHARTCCTFQAVTPSCTCNLKAGDLQDTKATAAGLQSLLNVMSSVYIPSMQADTTWPDTTKREFTGRHAISGCIRSASCPDGDLQSLNVLALWCHLARHGLRHT